MSCKTALFGSIALILGWNSTALAQTAGEPWEGFAGGFGVGYMHQEAKGLTASTGLFFDRGVRGSGPFTGASDLVSSMQTAGVAVSRTADHGSSKDSSAFSLFGVYNQRFDTFVAGIEASAVFGGASVKSIDRIAIDLAHLSGHAAGVDTAAFSVQGEAKNPWFVTLAPRLGVPAGDALLFAQAGVAVGRVEANWNYVSTGTGTGTTFASAAKTGSGSKTVIGFLLGVGVEYPLAPDVLIRADYTYVNMPERDIYNTSGLTAPLHIGFDDQQLRVAVSFGL